ncbi:MAG TPA: hypothetical protein VL485_19615 [Ktedonobacteraceae bacterium]|jgi:hypothetical protein|nr:hypothetical protein [Ktedonobacteraceae bacterium]
MSNSVLLRFANEEMIYLLRALQITDFPGLDPEPLKNMADSEKSLLMMAADHALRARGLIRWQGETEREVDPFVARVLLACARPRYTLFIDMRDSQLLHIFGPETIVEQCEPEPQVQQYLVMASWEDFSTRLQSLLTHKYGNGSVPLPGGQISRDLWVEALSVAQTDSAWANALLNRSLPPQTANALLAILHDPQQIQYLALWKQTPAAGQSAPIAALTIVVGHNQLILLHQDSPDTPLLEVIPASAEQAWEHVTRMLSLARVP